MKGREAHVEGGNSAFVMPFAQRETIDTIIDGIHSALQSKIAEILDEGVSKSGKKQLQEYVPERHEQPFMSAVAACRVRTSQEWPRRSSV